MWCIRWDSSSLEHLTCLFEYKPTRKRLGQLKVRWAATWKYSPCWERKISFANSIDLRWLALLFNVIYTSTQTLAWCNAYTDVLVDSADAGRYLNCRRWVTLRRTTRDGRHWSIFWNNWFILNKLICFIFMNKLSYLYRNLTVIYLFFLWIKSAILDGKLEYQ